jgi:hypothetical protein
MVYKYFIKRPFSFITSEYKIKSGKREREREREQFLSAAQPYHFHPPTN